MKTQKEKGSLLIDKMKNTHYILVLFLVFSCTSNTIFEKPKDIIPKDTMSLLIEDMMIASSARLIKTKTNKQTLTICRLFMKFIKLTAPVFRIVIITT